MSRSRGFSLVEVMIVLAIITLVVGMSMFALNDSTRRARLSSAKFTTLRTLSMAKQRAIARGTDVYVIFANLDSTAAWPPADTARIIIYEDPNLALRGSTDLMATVDANPGNIRDKYEAAGSSFGASGFAFVDLGSAEDIPSCGTLSSTTLPPYIQITGLRATQQDCRAWCTFCEIQGAGNKCVGAIRFSSTGKARIVTGPTTGTGGLIKLVSPTNRDLSACLAIGEPAGLAVAL